MTDERTPDIADSPPPEAETGLPAFEEEAEPPKPPERLTTLESIGTIALAGAALAGMWSGDAVRTFAPILLLAVLAFLRVLLVARSAVKAWDLSNTIIGNIAEDHGKLAEAHERSARTDDERFDYDRYGVKP